MSPHGEKDSDSFSIYLFWGQKLYKRTKPKKKKIPAFTELISFKEKQSVNTLVVSAMEIKQTREARKRL